MFNIIPIDIIETNKEDPPYEINGRVTPVTGIIPVTTHRFSNAWSIIPKDKPNTKYFANKSFCLKNIFKQR